MNTAAIPFWLFSAGVGYLVAGVRGAVIGGISALGFSLAFSFWEAARR